MICIIGEISGNHNGDYDKLLKLINECANAGCNAVKIQCFSPETITANSSRPEFLVKEGPWKGKTLYELYQSTYLPWEWYDGMFEYAAKIGIEVFASVFDETSANFIKNYNSKIVKIASPEIIDLDLLEYCSKIFSKLIVSTGMATKDEIIQASKIVMGNNTELTFLQCVSEYPANPESYNLGGLKFLSEYSHNVGISDHTLDINIISASVPLGIKFIEKHITLDRNDGGTDSHYSLEPAEFKSMVISIRQIEKALLHSDYLEFNTDSQNRKFRRSLFFNNDLNSGSIVKSENIKSIRPSIGLDPGDIHKILGKRLSKNVKTNDPVFLDLFC